MEVLLQIKISGQHFLVFIAGTNLTKKDMRFAHAHYISGSLNMRQGLARKDTLAVKYITVITCQCTQCVC